MTGKFFFGGRPWKKVEAGDCFGWRFWAPMHAPQRLSVAGPAPLHGTARQNGRKTGQPVARIGHQTPAWCRARTGWHAASGSRRSTSEAGRCGTTDLRPLTRNPTEARSWLVRRQASARSHSYLKKETRPRHCQTSAGILSASCWRPSKVPRGLARPIDQAACGEFLFLDCVSIHPPTIHQRLQFVFGANPGTGQNNAMRMANHLCPRASRAFQPRLLCSRSPATGLSQRHSLVGPVSMHADGCRNCPLLRLLVSGLAQQLPADWSMARPGSSALNVRREGRCDGT